MKINSGERRKHFPVFLAKPLLSLRKTLQSLNVLFQKKKAKLVEKIPIYLLFTSMIENKSIHVG